MSDPRSRTSKLMLASATLLLVAVGMTLALIGVSTPGYADGKPLNSILQVILQETPTPIPTPAAAACGVHMAQTAVLATDTATIELRNEGAAATVHAVTASWPVSNGDLVEVELGGRTIWDGVADGGSITVFPDLTEILPTIKTGEQTELTLRFSNGAAPGRYIALLHLGASCYAWFDSERVTAQVAPCFATFNRFDVEGQKADLVVQNTTTGPLAFERALIFWPDDQAAINRLQLGNGANLLDGSVTTSPVDVSLSVDSGITLQPEQSVALRLAFEEQAPLVGYTIVLQAEGCRSVFSNAQPPSECPIHQQGSFVVEGRTAGLALKNLGKSGRPIQEIWLSFPETNGALVDVILDDFSIIDSSGGRFPKTSSPATMTAGLDLLPDANLPPNSQSVLGFVFDQDAAPEHYTVEVALSDECRVLTTTRTNEPVPCQMQVDGDMPLRADGNHAWLALRNSGETQAELRAIQVDWPDSINGALTEVAIEGVPFWRGERTGGTATVTHNMKESVPFIEPGQSVELRLTFANRAVESPYVFRLEFAEDCSVAYATQPGLAMPTPVQFRGVIQRLPRNAFDGIWEMKLSGDEVVSLRVTPQTGIEPTGLTPRIGDFARVRALPAGDNEYLATHISVFPFVVEPVQRTGVIEEVDSGQPPGYIVVQGTFVDITPETDVQGELEVRWLADIEGGLRADGSILARVIRTTEPDVSVRRIDFQGSVEEWIQPPDPRIGEQETLWVVSGLDVIVHEVDTVHHGIEPGGRPEIGIEVQVSGDLVSARRVRARELWYGPGAEVEEFSGIIRGLPEDPSFEGVWKIGDSDDPVGRPVLVTPSTFLDTSEAMPVVGARVQVRARRNPDNNLEALWIKVIPSDE